MSLDKQKQNLIDIVEWYRDDYSYNKEYCNDIIEEIKICDEKQFHILEQVVDGWIDY